MTTETRVERVRRQRELRRRLVGVYFSRDYDDAAQERVEWMMGSPEIGDSGRMLVVIGNTHVGKSSVVMRALGRDPDLRETGAPNFKPVLRVELRRRVNMIGLGEEILKAVGYELGAQLSESRIWNRVEQQLRFRKVKVLWIDEAQHIIHIPKDGKFNDQEYVEYITNTFKGEMKTDGRRSVVLSGLPILKDFVEKDRQVAKMASFIKVPDLCDDDRGDLSDAIRALASEVGLRIQGDPKKLPKDPPEVCEADRLVSRLMHASGYAWGYALRLVIEAVLEAAAPTGIGKDVPEPDEELQLVHFATIWGRLTGSMLDSNPFDARNWEQIDCSVMLQQ